MHKGVGPQQMYKDQGLITEFQTLVHQQGIETEWPTDQE